MAKTSIIDFIEQTSSEACDLLDKLCFELVAKYGYSPKKPQKCKSQMKKDGLGIQFKYAFKDENIYLWWEMWKYDGKNPIELLDATEKLKIVTKVMKK